MAAVRAEDTKPELPVRKLLHAMGYRFRIYRKDLPGRPDIVLAKHQTCVFVHGCFWHRHAGCKRATMPATNVEFWRQKFDRNIERDEEAISALTVKGWKVVVIWECETREPGLLRTRLSELIRIGIAPPSEVSNRERAPSGLN